MVRKHLLQLDDSQLTNVLVGQEVGFECGERGVPIGHLLEHVADDGVERDDLVVLRTHVGVLEGVDQFWLILLCLFCEPVDLGLAGFSLVRKHTVDSDALEPGPD